MFKIPNPFKKMEPHEKQGLKGSAVLVSLIALGIAKQFTPEATAKLPSSQVDDSVKEATPDFGEVSTEEKTKIQEEMNAIFGDLSKTDIEQVKQVAKQLETTPEFKKFSTVTDKAEAEKMIRGLIVMAGMQIEDLSPEEAKELEAKVNSDEIKNIMAQARKKAGEISDEIIEPSEDM